MNLKLLLSVVLYTTAAAEEGEELHTDTERDSRLAPF